MLLQLRQNRTSLSVSVPGSDDQFQSIVLDTAMQEDHFLMDELAPVEGHKLLMKAGELKVQTRLNGSEMLFKTRLLGADSEGGTAFYQVAIPDWILYSQRRANYRVRVGYSTNIPVKAACEANRQVEGTLFNLSMGGFCLLTERLPDWQIGARIPFCKIEFDDGTSFDCEVELRNTRRHENGSDYLLGFMFTALNRPQKNYIQKKVVRLEREQLRRKSTTR